MFWKSTKKEPKDSNSNSNKDSSNNKALVYQDPRTKVRTATAESETTNTTEQSATIYDNLRNKVTQQTVRQTVTHQQTARVTEISIRRTPTKEELDELLKVSGGGGGANGAFFKSTTPWSKQETTVTQTNGREQKSFVQQQRAKWNQTATGAERTTPSKPTKATTTTTTTTFPDYTDSFGILSPLRALPPPPSHITAASLVINSIPLSKSSSVSSSSNASGFSYAPFSKYSDAQTGGMSKSYTAGSANAKISSTNAGWSSKAEGKGANVLSTGGRSALSSVKTTTALPPTPPRSTLLTTTTASYVSPYAANRARGPLASSYTYAYGKPSASAVSAVSKYETRALADANPTATMPKIQMPTTTTTTTTTRQPTMEKIATPLAKLNFGSRLTEAQTHTQSQVKSKLKPGYAVIFNSVDFADKERFEKRDGSDYDAKLIRDTLEKYKLKVDTVKNPTVKKIKDFVKTLTKKDYTHYSCLIIAILSHGSVHDSIAASDGEYNVDETMLYPLLDIPSLKEKPKIFIIQACKGALIPGEYKTDASIARGSPSEILKCYSTFEGYVSYRTEKGSPFVQALCEEIKLKGQNTDIEKLMKNAIESVKIRTRSNQIPCMTTNLTKPFVFGNYV